MASVTFKPVRGSGPKTWKNIPNAYDDNNEYTYANVSISPANAVNRSCDFYFDLSSIGLGATINSATLSVSLGYGGSDNMCMATFEISTTEQVLYTTSLINESTPQVYTTNIATNLIRNLQGIKVRPHVDVSEGIDREWGFLIYDISLTIDFNNSGGSKTPYLGTTKINDIYLGTSQIKKVYLGTTEVYSSGNSCTSLTLNPTSSNLSTISDSNTTIVHVTIGPSNCTEPLTYTKSGSSATIEYNLPFDTGHSFLITAVSAGTTTITFKCGSKTAIYTVISS